MIIWEPGGGILKEQRVNNQLQTIGATSLEFISHSPLSLSPSLSWASYNKKGNKTSKDGPILSLTVTIVFSGENTERVF